MSRPTHTIKPAIAPLIAANPAKAVALETTLLIHGVPANTAQPLANELNAIVTDAGAIPATIGVVDGIPTAGMTGAQLVKLLESHKESPVAKANTANLGILMHQRAHAATTVSATMEIAAAAGISLFATGGIGGVHRGYGTHLDISADLAALARFPVAVVASGVKSILDVTATREALETLGVPVVGFQTDTFPAFYLRSSEAQVDARFDSLPALASFVRAELNRTGRGILIANPIPEADELDKVEFHSWLVKAEAAVSVQGATARQVTPAILGALHQVSNGATLTANLALVRSNTKLATALASI